MCVIENSFYSILQAQQSFEFYCNASQAERNSFGFGNDGNVRKRYNIIAVCQV